MRIPTSSVTLLRAKRLTDGSMPIYLQISFPDQHEEDPKKKYKRAMMSLGETIKPELWDAHNQRAYDRTNSLITRIDSNATAINSLISRVLKDLNYRIQTLQAEAEENNLQYLNTTAAQLTEALEDKFFPERKKHTLAPDAANCFFKLADDAIKTGLRADREEAMRPGTLERRDVVLKAFAKFVGSTTFPVDRMNKETLRQFYDWMQTTNKSKQTTAHVYARIIRTIYGQVADANKLPRFEPSKLSQGESEARAALTPEQVHAIGALPVTGAMAVYRDMFMTAYLTYGRRISDILTLEWSHIKRGKIVQKMMKTGEAAGAPVEKELAEIFERYRIKGRKYVFPLLEEGLNETDQSARIKYLTSRYNRGLIRLGRKAGIEEHISSHTARNSFAVAAYLATRSIVMVQQMLGHKKASTTETYLKSLRPDLFVLEIEAVTASLYSGFRAA